MEDWPDREYFTESLKGRRSSADVRELIADDNEMAISLMSGSYAQSVYRAAKAEERRGNLRRECTVAAQDLNITPR